MESKSTRSAAKPEHLAQTHKNRKQDVPEVLPRHPAHSGGLPISHEFTAVCRGRSRRATPGVARRSLDTKFFRRTIEARSEGSRALPLGGTGVGNVQDTSPPLSICRKRATGRAESIDHAEDSQIGRNGNAMDPEIRLRQPGSTNSAANARQNGVCLRSRGWCSAGKSKKEGKEKENEDSIYKNDRA